jgi:hypothetical protein
MATCIENTADGRGSTIQPFDHLTGAQDRNLDMNVCPHSVSLPFERYVAITELSRPSVTKLLRL